jgi:hypothetical protein
MQYIVSYYRFMAKIIVVLNIRGAKLIASSFFGTN